MFSDYINHGWKLCRIEPGSKGPRYQNWNLPGNELHTAQGVQAAGLLHAYSGTCALDLDDIEKASAYLYNHGICLADLLLAPDAVQISSGRPNRGKLLYAMSQPLPSKSFAEGAFELRCGTAGGKSAQDVLPPSPHPSGSIYRWVGDWKNLPMLPEGLLSLWTAVEHTKDTFNVYDGVLGSRTFAELRSLLTRRDPSCGYDEWLKIGMICHHESEGSDEGFALWDDWSSKSDKYRGAADLNSHWGSFGRTGNPITIDSLRKTDVATTDEFEIHVPEQQDRARKPRFVILSGREFCSRPKPTWLIKDVLPERGVGCFWGPENCGKTFLALDAAMCVALGSPWHDSYEIIKPGPVLYIAAEDDHGVQLRYEAAMKKRGISVDDTPIDFLAARPKFGDKKEQEELLNVIKAKGEYRIVVVDTFAKVSFGVDENSAKEVGAVLEFCRNIEETVKGLVITLHHANKNGTIRGSSAVAADADVAWNVTYAKDEDEHNWYDQRKIYVNKMKNAPMGAKYDWWLHQVPGTDSCVVDWNNGLVQEEQ